MIKATLRTISLTCIASLLSSYSAAGTIELYYNQFLDSKKTLTKSQSTSIEEKQFNQLIDHGNPSTGTFTQRYYVDESLSTSNDSPVFFYICGESVCNKSKLTGAIRQYAEKYHAKLVALEHRYYGSSLPYQELTTDHLKYLTTDNALKDLARFQVQLSKDQHWTGKWIVFGGSYSGSLSAYYRLTNPKLAAGSLASSAPVMAKDNFDEFDAHVTKVAGEVCANNMRAAVTEVESAFNDDKRFSEIQKMFGAEDITDKTDFVSMIAEIGAAAIQYGMRDSACSILATSKTPLEGYATAAKYILKMWGIKPKDLVFQGAVSTNADDYKNGIGMRQWYYQSCTEYGYWQTANADAAKSSRSALINLDYYREGCKRLFGKDLHADIDKTNRNYYTPLLNEDVTNIYFTNGSSDPWSNLSMTVNNGNTTNKNLTYYMIDGSAHCDDLRSANDSESDSLKLARHKLDALLATWL